MKVLQIVWNCADHVGKAFYAIMMLYVATLVVVPIVMIVNSAWVALAIYTVVYALALTTNNAVNRWFKSSDLRAWLISHVTANI